MTFNACLKHIVIMLSLFKHKFVFGVHLYGKEETGLD